MEPFNETKYRALMDGLECREIFSSDITNQTTFRLDSDYYKKEYMSIDKAILKNKDKFTSIDSLGLVVNASAFYPSLEPYYNTGKIPFIRVADVKDRINYASCVRIPEMDSSFNTLYLCKKGDIVLTKGGSIGNVGLITQDSYVTRDLIFLNSSVLDRVNYICLYLFFSTAFMYKQMIKSSSYSVQPHLTITLIRELLIYKYSNTFKSIVSAVYEKSEELMIKSKEHYCEAEHLLLSELGMAGFMPSTNVVSEKLFTKSFLLSGRLDAEYYQDKYDYIEEKIRNYYGGYTTFADAIEYIFTGEYAECYYKKQNELAFYIRSTNMNNGQIIIDNDYFVDKKLFSKHVTVGDIVTARVGTVGKFAEVENNLNGAICSDNVICFRFPPKLDPSVYTLLLNSSIMFEMVDRLARGSVQQRLNQETLKDLIIPIIDDTAQKTIKQKINQSFKLSKQSHELLENAKQAVQIAIEEGEEKALQWLDEVMA